MRMWKFKENERKAVSCQLNKKKVLLCWRIFYNLSFQIQNKRILFSDFSSQTGLNNGRLVLLKKMHHLFTKKENHKLQIPFKSKNIFIYRRNFLVKQTQSPLDQKGIACKLLESETLCIYGE